ncbi:MAG: restriction endonuclease [Fimbriimonadia bacterium]|nr:restriction endonuclease [Fimbriimonadia bacterium]
MIRKVPQESEDYVENSEYVLGQILMVMREAVKTQKNRVYRITFLKRGLPLENINKIAGPIIEAWVLEQFEETVSNSPSNYQVVHVQSGKRLDFFDLIVQFKRKNDSESPINANIDVKTTSEDIRTAGKSPNITSYARIRSQYLNDPNCLFIILSIKHKAYLSDDQTIGGMINSVIEILDYRAFDLKYIAEEDISYNPALGTGQLQLRNILSVSLKKRTTWEFLQMLDTKFIRSRGEDAWIKLAKHHRWLVEEE